MYFIAGKLGLKLAVVNASATAVWPPTGIALAALLVFGYRVWPGIFLGAFLVNITTVGSLATTLGIATGNTLEGLAGAYLINRFANGRRALERSQDVFKFATLAALLSTTVSATFGVTSLCLGGYARWADYEPIWLTWWLGDAVGAFIVAPLLLLWSADPRVRWPKAKLTEAVLVIAVLILMGQAVFGSLLPVEARRYLLPYICVPVLIWVAFRFGSREAATATFLLSAIALWGTLRGFGPFARDVQNESLLLLQAFMAINALMALTLAAVATERTRGEEALRKAHDGLELRVQERTAALSHVNDQLQDREALLHGLFEHAPDAILAADRQRNIQRANAQAETMFGYRREELLGLPVETLIPECFRERHVSDRMGNAAEPHTRSVGTGLDLHGRRKDGSEFPVDIMLSPLEAAAGRMVIAIVRDITRRKRAEEVIRANEERFRLLVENVKDYAIYMLDPTGHIASWNAGAERITGYLAEEIIGRHCACFYPQADVEWGKPLYELKLAEVSGRFEEEGWRLRKDGSLFLASVVITALRDQAGNLRGFSKITHDITERKRIEQALEEERTLLRSLIDTIPDHIYIKDLDGRYALDNIAHARFVGAKGPEEVVGKSVFDCFPAPLAEEYAAEDRNVLRTGQPLVNKEEEIVNRAGYTRWVSTTKVPLRDRRESIIGLVCTSRDTTERKRAEERLQQTAAALEKSNAELQQFAYVASHDLQEPLRVVASYLQLLARQYRGKLDAEADNFIQRAVNGVKRMQTLIADLLAYSRVGAQAEALAKVDCAELVAQALADLEEAVKEQGAVVTHDPLPTVVADRSQITQLFQNLIGNALKFRSKEAPRIHVGATAQDGAWVFSVRDNGIGIDLQYAERIFLIFQRLHTRTEYPGTGIGLAICKKIVENHRGRIWVESQAGQGATFYFTIPQRNGGAA